MEISLLSHIFFSTLINIKTSIVLLKNTFELRNLKLFFEQKISLLHSSRVIDFTFSIISFISFFYF